MKDVGLFSFKKRRLKNDLITDFKIMRSYEAVYGDQLFCSWHGQRKNKF